MYNWNAQAALSRVECECGSNRSAIGLEAFTKIPLIPIRKLPTGETILLSSLGLWTCTPRGELRDLKLPDGQRLCICPPSFGSASSAWSNLGQSSHGYDSRSVLSSVIHPDGTRAMFRRIAGTNHAYLVTSGGVSVYEYDSKGRLRKVRSADGQYTSLSYGWDGTVKKIATAQGWIELWHDHGRIVGIKLGSDITGKVTYDPGGHPVVISISAKRQPLFYAAMAICAALWQWTALKPPLRLEDKKMQEV
jgi:YD repeat-containing protein